jgi:small subunit ribosomal protein S9
METTHTIGRRKTSIARVYLTRGNGSIKINNKDYKEYFTTLPLQYKINQVFHVSKTMEQFDAHINVEGGGITGQAEAIRMAIARAMIKIDPEQRPALKAEGFLTRDPRMVERKKSGQKKARKRFQFSKR